MQSAHHLANRLEENNPEAMPNSGAIVGSNLSSSDADEELFPVSVIESVAELSAH